jgi:hypothetical protein
VQIDKANSQARQLLEGEGLAKSKIIILDFDQVDSVGQAFADEVFRVFHKQHPEIDLWAVNTTDAIDKMIRRAKTVKKET